MFKMSNVEYFDNQCIATSPKTLCSWDDTKSSEDILNWATASNEKTSKQM